MSAARGLFDVVLVGRMRIGTSNLAWSQIAALACPRSTLVGSERNTGPQGAVDANFMRGGWFPESLRGLSLTSATW